MVNGCEKKGKREKKGMRKRKIETERETYRQKVPVILIRRERCGENGMAR